MLTRFRSLTVTIAALLLFAGMAHARVFSRWRGASNVRQTLENLGGTVGYATAIQLNGGAGNLTVFRFGAGLDDLIAQMKQGLGIQDMTYAGGTLALGTLASDDRMHRFVAARLPDLNQTLVFHVDQSKADYESSNKPPDKQPAMAVPPFPGSSPAFFVRDVGADMALAVSRTASTPEAVEAFYASSLTGDGWSRFLAPGKGRTAPGGALYFQRGAEICVILVSPSSSSAENRLAVLHKRLRMK